MIADIPEFGEAIYASVAWLDDLMRRLGWRDRGKVYLALCAALHALRDHLPQDEAVSLGAFLPALLRGFYYAGWHPRGRPLPLASRDAFLIRIQEGVHRDPGIDPEQVAHAVFGLLADRIPAAELEEIKAVSPASLYALWPS